MFICNASVVSIMIMMEQLVIGVFVIFLVGTGHDVVTSTGQNLENFEIFTQAFIRPTEEEAGNFTDFCPTNYDFNELDSKVTEIPNCVCGVQPFSGGNSSGVTPLIYGGVEAVINEFPWVVALIHSKKLANGTIQKHHFCGGSLINSRFILTAQHCLLDMKVSQTEVWLNEHDLLLSTETIGMTIKRQAVSFILHPNYNKFMHYNDLALIELDEEVDILDSRLRSICLPKARNDEKAPVEGITAGWGQRWFEGPKSDKLLKVELPIIPNSKCINASVPYYKRRVTDYSICAGELEHGTKDTCPGDSGGGLFVKDRITGNYELFGICSFGVRCGESGRPGVYIKVSSKKFVVKIVVNLELLYFTMILLYGMTINYYFASRKSILSLNYFCSAEYLKWILNESRTGRQCSGHIA